MPGDYPTGWRCIACMTKVAAHWKCEHCGHEHDPENGYCLTVHHLDGDKSKCDRRNLVALCQRCHLHIQAVYIPGQQSFIKYPWAVKRGLM